MINTILLTYGALVSGAYAVCSRAMLQLAAGAYLEAQSAGQPFLLPLAETVSYAENDTPMSIDRGVLAQPIVIDFNRSFIDTTACSFASELSATTNKHPYVINTRMLFVDERITTIESVVSDNEDWVQNATSQLSWTKKEQWDPIPEEKRDSRAVIKAAGDAYLDSWYNGSIPVPYGTPCARLEGGAYTGERNMSSNSCKMPEFPKPAFTGAKNRRYVIDEELGAVDIFNDFPFIDKVKPNGTASTNLIRVEGGKIRYIHEIRICATRNCGR